MKKLHTCQLTRLDKFSTVNLYSVRVGGPYLNTQYNTIILVLIIFWENRMYLKILVIIKIITYHENAYPVLGC